MATVEEKNIDGIKRERKVTRSLFTKNANILENLLTAYDNNESLMTITTHYLKLEELQSQLTDLDREIRKLLRDSDEAVLEREMESAIEYRTRWIAINCKYKQLTEHNNSIEKEKRNFKLPTLEFITFDGDIKGWLPFWGQFEKIHKDSHIDMHDKYQYLLQSMKSGSEPRALVESFSHMSYNDCLDQLKARYAREELLIQVYVRELLGMINKNENCNITTLFDKLSAQLRALEILGVTKDKFAAFLLPMIESLLSKDLLKIWERAKNEDKNISIELTDLLKFLKKEVESEQRIMLAKKTLVSTEDIECNSVEPTAGCLLTEVALKKPVCIWCEKDSHGSLECFKLQKMSIEERRSHMKAKKICAICLKKGHHPKFCKAFVKCMVCGQRHAVVLCTGQKRDSTNSLNNDNLAAKSESIGAASAGRGLEPISTNISADFKRNATTTLLQTVAVLVGRGKKQMMVRAMFDNGAQRSYIREDIARKLNITAVAKESLVHNLFGGFEITSKLYNLYNIDVTSIDNTFSFNLTVLGQECICVNIPKYSNLSYLLSKHDITLSDIDTQIEDVGLLIGADFSGYVLTGQMIKLQDSLFAIKTKLGWTLQGRVGGSSRTDNITAHATTFYSADLTNFWSLETLGIRDPVETKTKKQCEEEVLASFEENVAVNSEGRYEVFLPWKVGHDELLNNYDLASRRLRSVTKRLRSNDLYDDYNKIFKEWSDKGIIEKIPDSPVSLDMCHYLPHRPVIREKSLTTRIRPVFDASAKDRNNKSLNLCLDKGVNMLDKISKLLIGFRKRAIGVTSDIAKAFLQVSVTPRDRDMLRFLWWDENQKEIIIFRHCRVVFGLTSSPFLLSATILHHLNRVTGIMKESADILAGSFYVDNCQTSLETVEAVVKFQTEAKELMRQAKFDLTQWEIAPVSNVEKDKVISVLGLQWHMAVDKLVCNLDNLPIISALDRITKRYLLSITQRIYDPIGFTAAVTLVPRLILQETWRRKVDWEEEIPDDLKKKFIRWYETLPLLEQCRIPRRLTASPIDESVLELHMFCDASRDAYAACVFLRAESKAISVRLVSAKSRVAPPEKLTIPRLELLAALIGSRLLVEARKDIGIRCKEYCWTDSRVALCWIKKELPWNTYVGNRVKEIRLNTDVNNWFHVSGSLNWADLISRGCDVSLLVSSRWLDGPTWLYSSREQWPISSIDLDEAGASCELKKTMVNNAITNPGECITNQLSYFSLFTKIIRTVAWMFRFVHNTRNKNRLKGEISYEEYEASEVRVISMIQTENRHYIEEKIKGLTYFCDENKLIRIKTKLLLTDFPETTKFPAVLPATNFITRRLVEQRHLQLLHAGVGTVLADLRVKYWIIGARKLVKQVIAHCTVCRRQGAKPLHAPTAPLPIERTRCSAPFEVTGVDLAGPLYLKEGQKCWIVLYTCAVYRAVHLELARSLSTETFLMTLRRFVARRGRPNVIISDNGKNFIGTNNLFSGLDWNEIQRHSTIQRIKWKFNAPTAAWWGGFWERLIKILKDLLKRVLGRSSVSYEELETVICDCEATMNGRPLTYIEDEKTKSLEPLTPSCFLHPIVTTDVVDVDVIDSNSMNKRLRYLQNLRQNFRQRFRSEYLTSLVQRGKEKQESLKIGDIVLIETEEKRIKWPLGLVEEIYSGRDNINRTAKVRTSIGYKIRPFQRLYKLEVEASDIPRKQTGTERSELKTTRSGRVSRMPSRFLW